MGVDQRGDKKTGAFEWVPTVFPESDGIYSTYSQIVERRKADDKTKRTPTKPSTAPKQPRAAAPRHLKAFNKYSLEQIESTIANLEDEKEQLNARFGEAAVYQNPERLADLNSRRTKIEKDIALWYEAWEYRLEKTE